MNFEYSAKTREMIGRVRAFMDEHIYPNEKRYAEEVASGERWKVLPVIEELKPKAVLTTPNGAAIVRVVEKAETTDADFTSNKDTFRNEVLDDRRNRFFSAYMVKAKQKMKIEVNREAVARVIG